MSLQKLILASLFLFATQLWAKESKASSSSLKIQSTVSNSEIHIGDRFLYRIEVLSPDSGRVELPGVVGNLGTFEVIEYSPNLPQIHGKGLKYVWELKLSTFLSGDYVIPPQIVEYTPKGSDSVSIRLQTEPVRIKVLTRNPDDASDILGAEDLLDAPKPFPWFWVAIGIIIILLILGLLYYFRSKKEPEIKRLPPWEEADLALKELLKQEFSDSLEDQKQIAFSLTALLKTYVGRRYEVSAEESTSAEFLALAKTLSDCTENLRTRLQDFVEKTDLVKYAGILVSKEEFEIQQKFVRNFLDLTKPLPVEDSQKNTEEKKG